MLPVTSIITRNVITCEKHSSILEAAKKMAENHIGSIVVVEGNNPVGIFTQRDLLVRAVAKNLDLTKVCVSEVMTKDLVVAEENDTCSGIYMQMKAKKIRHLPVVKNGELTGIVSLKNILHLMNDFIIKEMDVQDYSGLY
ncbi:MAG: CBS domain-containing protein [Candidatus Brocadiae bacterium]|nr:CBS domain-containing protein [Candidatus Brocadiia bacterium]